MTKKDNIVSFDDEKLIVVDEQDNILGYKTKAQCHKGEGILHRAFSIFIFNDHKQILLQQRSREKQLWPLYWSNSCCSHPRKGEEMADAAHRRLFEELGLRTSLKYLYKFQYHAGFGAAGSENEICSVFIGKSNGQVSVNHHEIAGWKFVDVAELNWDMTEHPEKYTPWFKMEWERIQNEYWGDVEALF